MVTQTTIKQITQNKTTMITLTCPIISAARLSVIFLKPEKGQDGQDLSSIRRFLDDKSVTILQKETLYRLHFKAEVGAQKTPTMLSRDVCDIVPILNRCDLDNTYESIEQFCEGGRDLPLQEYGIMDTKTLRYGFNKYATVWISKNALDYFKSEEKMLDFAKVKIMEYWNIKFQYFNHLCWLKQNGKEVNGEEFKSLWSELIELHRGFQELPVVAENLKLLYTGINKFK